MSDIRLNILDRQRTVHVTIPSRFSAAVAASLAAEPENLDELTTALSRFFPLEVENGVWGETRSGLCLSPCSGGLVIIDLEAELCVFETVRPIRPRGSAPVWRGAESTEVMIPYLVPESWLFQADLHDWCDLSVQRRRERELLPPLDYRQVLYGELPHFVAARCCDVKSQGATDPVVGIHIEWLMTSREDLRGVAPRDVLLSRREFVDADLDARARQWSQLGECPPGLPTESRAARLAGFGTNEIVLYYELVRQLLENCWTEGPHEPWFDVDAEAHRLDELARTWWENQQEELCGMSPAEVVQKERLRLPVVATDEHAMIDHDCPVCRMMAEQMGPVFWNLDGCNMEDDFAFSFFRTKEEWESERELCGENVGMLPEDEIDDDLASHGRDFARIDNGERSRQISASFDNSPWRQSYMNEAVLADMPIDQQVSLWAFGLAGHVAELEETARPDANCHSPLRELGDSFHRLCAALRGRTSWLARSYIAQCHEEVDTLAFLRDDLRDRCQDFQRKLQCLDDIVDRWCQEDDRAN